MIVPRGTFVANIFFQQQMFHVEHSTALQVHLTRRHPLGTLFEKYTNTGRAAGQCSTWNIRIHVSETSGPFRPRTASDSERPDSRYDHAMFHVEHHPLILNQYGGQRRQEDDVPRGTIHAGSVQYINPRIHQKRRQTVYFAVSLYKSKYSARRGRLRKFY